MGTLINHEDINHLIASQKSSIRFLVLHAVVIFVIGLLLFVIANFFADAGTVKVVVNTAGAFLTTLVSFPVKGIISRREKIGTFLILQRHIGVINSGDSTINEEERSHTINLIKEILKRYAIQNV
jgi:hypothetical protein